MSGNERSFHVVGFHQTPLYDWRGSPTEQLGGSENHAL
jgi:hypothetical protein